MATVKKNFHAKKSFQIFIIKNFLKRHSLFYPQVLNLWIVSFSQKKFNFDNKSFNLQLSVCTYNKRKIARDICYKYVLVNEFFLLAYIDKVEILFKKISTLSRRGFLVFILCIINIYNFSIC